MASSTTSSLMRRLFPQPDDARSGRVTGERPVDREDREAGEQLLGVPTLRCRARNHLDVWSASWISLGATEDGSKFKYETTIEAVEVADGQPHRRTARDRRTPAERPAEAGHLSRRDPCPRDGRDGAAVRRRVEPERSPARPLARLASGRGSTPAARAPAAPAPPPAPTRTRRPPLLTTTSRAAQCSGSASRTVVRPFPVPSSLAKRRPAVRAGADDQAPCVRARSAPSAVVPQRCRVTRSGTASRTYPAMGSDPCRHVCDTPICGDVGQLGVKERSTAAEMGKRDIEHGCWCRAPRVGF
jgi:hypothetical protein